ncbi:MAG: hypothetical protein KDK39_10795 [Leptospiraceae bacterium]|nr:hypothetical protein [Leptospiraceae bacterium]
MKNYFYWIFVFIFFNSCTSITYDLTEFPLEIKNAEISDYNLTTNILYNKDTDAFEFSLSGEKKINGDIVYGIKDASLKREEDGTLSIAKGMGKHYYYRILSSNDNIKYIDVGSPITFSGYWESSILWSIVSIGTAIPFIAYDWLFLNPYKLLFHPNRFEFKAKREGINLTEEELINLVKTNVVELVFSDSKAGKVRFTSSKLIIPKSVFLKKLEPLDTDVELGFIILVNGNESGETEDELVNGKFLEIKEVQTLIKKKERLEAIQEAKEERAKKQRCYGFDRKIQNWNRAYGSVGGYYSKVTSTFACKNICDEVNRRGLASWEWALGTCKDNCSSCY